MKVALAEKGKRQRWFHEDTRGGRRRFPKWETMLVSKEWEAPGFKNKISFPNFFF